MVINEKALVAQMKNTYQSYGYTVAVNDDLFYLTNGFWLAEIDIDRVPGEIMGMFGEHIRAIPKSGEAYKVIKGKDGAVVQSRLLPEVMGTVKQMHHHRAEADRDGPMQRMGKTNLTYDDFRVWQGALDLGIFLIDPRYAAMIEKTKEVYRVGEGIYAEDEESKLWILRVNKDEDKTYLAHLEEITWIKE